MNIPSLQSPSAFLQRPFASIGAAVILLTFTSCATAPVPTGADLKGTWAQTGAGYEQGRPVTWENQTVIIEEADGQGFAGFKEYTRKGGQPQKESVNGVIGFDGTVLIVDEDGTFRGRFVGGKLRGQYAEIGADATAINLELDRK